MGDLVGLGVGNLGLEQLVVDRGCVNLHLGMRMIRMNMGRRPRALFNLCMILVSS